VKRTEEALLHGVPKLLKPGSSVERDERSVAPRLKLLQVQGAAKIVTGAKPGATSRRA
jgi:hypothetical protein